MTILITDLYSENELDFEELREDGFTGIVFKAGQGRLGNVPRLHPNWWNDAKKEGFLRGWYWLMDSRYRPSLQVEELKVETDLDFGELGMWVDAEKFSIKLKDVDYWLTPYSGYNHMYDFIHRIQQTGASKFPDHLPGYYTSPSFWNLISGKMPQVSKDWFAKMLLWTANYPFIYLPGISKPTMYGSWKNWIFWQYKENPDYSVFNGSDADFYKLFNIGEIPAPEPPPVVVPPEDESVPEISVSETYEVPRYAIVRHRPPEDSTRSALLPETVPMQDRPAGVGKGSPIPLLPLWRDYILKINSEKAGDYALSIGMMWINSWYDQSDPNAIPKVESITNGHNIVSYVKMEAGHIMLQAFPYDQKELPFTPAQVNWYTRPDLFFKAQSTNNAGSHMKVTTGLDVYLPYLRKTELWLPIERVELFPELPVWVTVNVSLKIRALPWGVQTGTFRPLERVQVIAYRPLGVDIWGQTRVGWICLKQGENYYTSWKLETPGVLPPG